MRSPSSIPGRRTVQQEVEKLLVEHYVRRRDVLIKIFKRWHDHRVMERRRTFDCTMTFPASRWTIEMREVPKDYELLFELGMDRDADTHPSM